VQTGKEKEMDEVDYIPEGIDSKTMIRIGNEEVKSNVSLCIYLLFVRIFCSRLSAKRRI
jgi:hypothetical protein